MYMKDLVASILILLLIYLRPPMLVKFSNTLVGKLLLVLVVIFSQDTTIK